MADASIKYEQPTTGTEIATTSFTEDSTTKHFQRMQTGYQTFLFNKVVEFTNEDTTNSNIYPHIGLSGISGGIWTLSGSGTNEYYLGVEKYQNLDVIPTAGTIILIENGTELQRGSGGSLIQGTWAIDDNDSLGYNTLYVRLTDDTDPDSKAVNFLTANFGYYCKGTSRIFAQPIMTVAAQSVSYVFLIYPLDFNGGLISSGGNVYAQPLISEVFTSTGLTINKSAYPDLTYCGPYSSLDIYSAYGFTIAVTSPPASGTVSFLVGAV